MKKLLLISIIAILSLGCSNESNSSKMPPETQKGANTFGVTIKGKVYIPRTPTGNDVGPPARAMILWGVDGFYWDELEVKDGASPAGFKMYIHMEPLRSVGKITLHQSNFHHGIDSVPYSNIYFMVWDSSVADYAYYGSIENQGEINITRLDSGIISGNFKGKFVRYGDPDDIIEIKDGRFDINSITLPNTVFP